MANICANYVTISGDKVSLKKLRKRINEQDPKLVDTFCGCLESCSHKGVAYGLESDLPLGVGGPLELMITSKWSPPEKDFRTLSTEYPKLLIEVRYEEPGNDLYGNLAFQDGSKVLDEAMEEIDYLMKYEEEFKDAVSDIKDTDYKYFRKQYIIDDDYKGDYQWETHGYFLERMVVERAKLRDLPALVDKFEYCDDLVKEKLSSGK
jgi:hypothetical protein